MKIKLFICMAAIAFLFTQQLSAQEVSSVLRSKKKRQILYSSIINSDAMFFEFMESTKAAGRTKEGILVLNQENTETAGLADASKISTFENGAAMKQMVNLVREFAAVNPEFQKMIKDRYPEVGRMMRKDKLKL